MTDPDATRVVDANRNRALEALRVVEDHARFVLDAAGLAARAKDLRHDLQRALAGIDGLAARDVGGAVEARWWSCGAWTPVRGGTVAGHPASGKPLSATPPAEAAGTAAKAARTTAHRIRNRNLHGVGGSLVRASGKLETK